MVPTGAVVVVDVDVGDPFAQGVGRMTSSSRVTAPLRARARPLRVTCVVRVIDVNAMMVPWKSDPEPSVAELPTTQNT